MSPQTVICGTATVPTATCVLWLRHLPPCCADTEAGGVRKPSILPLVLRQGQKKVSKYLLVLHH